MLQPENQSKKYDFLFNDIDNGRTKIPKFQRDFVWDKEQTAKLIDSIIKGFPIGTFILWKTREQLREVKNIGNIELPASPKGDAVHYVLDGQQRITSLYAVRKGLIINKDGKLLDYRDIFIRLDVDPDIDEQIVTTEPPQGTSSISVYKLLNGLLTEFLADYSKDELEKIEIYQKRLTGYDFSTIVIADYPIDVACEVFTRINTGGTELTLFEIMVAKTYDLENGFDLAEAYDRLIDSQNEEKDLEDANFDTVPAVTVLQCVAAYMERQIRRRDILLLNKYGFIDSWLIVKDGIFTAVDYVRSYLRVPVSRLLPYNTLLVPLTYFFIHNNGEMPTPKQHRLLTQYFFWASLSQRYSSGVEGKIVLDLKRMDDILRGDAPNYQGEEFSVSVDELSQQWFSAGNAFCKAILCLYAYYEPKSFASNSLVKIDNSWLKAANSKNYHHFFPKAYLRRQGYEDWQANSILNITIVDDYLNKRRIGAKAPSEYMLQFRNENQLLDETMSTHLIDDMDEFGIWQDDYERFLEQRGNRVVEELTARLNPRI